MEALSISICCESGPFVVFSREEGAEEVFLIDLAHGVLRELLHSGHDPRKLVARALILRPLSQLLQ